MRRNICYEVCAKTAWAVLAVLIQMSIGATRADELCEHGCGVCRKEWALCPCPQGTAHNFQAGKCVDSCKNNRGCQAQVEVDRLIKEAQATLDRVQKNIQSTQSSWRACEGPADVLWKACKAGYQPEYDKCLQKENKSKTECDARLAQYCADTPPSDEKCKEQISEYNRLNYQRMELEQDLIDLKKLSFQCPPDGKCPDVSRKSMLFPDAYSEKLCGRNTEGKLNDAAGDSLWDVGTGKSIGRAFMNCTFP